MVSLDAELSLYLFVDGMNGGPSGDISEQEAGSGSQ